MKKFKECIHQLAASSSKRDFEIFEARQLCGDKKPSPRRVLSEKYNISCNRVRDIEKKMQKKLHKMICDQCLNMDDDNNDIVDANDYLDVHCRCRDCSKARVVWCER